MSEKKNLTTLNTGYPVFQNKSKTYEVYQLRKTYEKRLTAGLISTVSLFLLRLGRPAKFILVTLPKVVTPPAKTNPAWLK